MKTTLFIFIIKITIKINWIIIINIQKEGVSRVFKVIDNNVGWSATGVFKREHIR